MAGNNGYSTKRKRETHLDSINPGPFMLSEDHHRKSENHYDREYDLYDSHGSWRTSRGECAPRQGHPPSRGRHNHSDYTSDRSTSHHCSEDRHSGSTKHHYHHRRVPHDRPKTINNYSHESFDGVDDERERSNGHYTTDRNAADEHRHRPHPFILGQKTRSQEKMDEPDLRRLVHEKRRHWDNEHPQREGQGSQEYRSLACASSSLKARHKPSRGHTDDDLDEQTAADRGSERRHRRHDNNSRGRSSSSSNDSDDSRGTRTPTRERSSQRGRYRSPSHSESRSRSESHHRGRNPSQNHSTVDTYSRSSHSRKHKRKHKDRSTSRDNRKRRKHKERGREKEKEKKAKMKEDSEERRSVLTGKKIKLKVKKDKGDHERDANRKDLLQFLNSAFE